MTPVPIKQHVTELEAVLKIYCALQPQRVLEVGSWHGGTLYHWIKNAVPGAIVASIDMPMNGSMSSRQKWGEWASQAGVTLAAWVGNSHDKSIMQRADNLAPFDFIFIDGDHSWNGVKSDFDNYFPMVRPGGCIVFHDIAAADDNPLIQVGLWWREMIATIKNRTEEIISTPGSGGMGVVWA